MGRSVWAAVWWVMWPRDARDGGGEPWAGWHRAGVYPPASVPTRRPDPRPASGGTARRVPPPWAGHRWAGDGGIYRAVAPRVRSVMAPPVSSRPTRRRGTARRNSRAPVVERPAALRGLPRVAAAGRARGCQAALVSCAGCASAGTGARPDRRTGRDRASARRGGPAAPGRHSGTPGRATASAWMGGRVGGRTLAPDSATGGVGACPRPWPGRGDAGPGVTGRAAHGAPRPWRRERP